MTVFCLRGSIIETDLDGQITDVQPSILDAVTRIGTNTLDIAYLGDLENPFAVSLSDYNLLFDAVHINDGRLPDQVEYFDLSTDDGHSVRVINFLFETSTGTEERMYCAGETPLPDFKTPGEASLFFAQHEPEKITSQDDWSIPLAKIVGVQTNGVFIDLDTFEAPYSMDNDAFHFSDYDPAPDTQVWEIELAAAALGQDAMAATLDGGTDHAAEIDNDEHDLEHNVDPAFGEFNEG